MNCGIVWTVECLMSPLMLYKCSFQEIRINTLEILKSKWSLQKWLIKSPDNMIKYNKFCLQHINDKSGLKLELWAHTIYAWCLSCAFVGKMILNSLRPGDAKWRQRYGSTLAQVMACCLMAPSHYLNRCWLIISEIQWHSSEDNFHKRYLSHQLLELAWKWYIYNCI